MQRNYPQLFTGLGTMGSEYTIKLKPNPKPYSLSTPRNIPLPPRDKVKEELERMTKLGVISIVETPTEWCAGMVVVPKKSSGSIRICVDLRPLNENVMSENFPLPKVDEILAQLAGARFFSKLDANMGFWQIPLSPECRSLTTFITPFGRFHFNKLPFGVSCASELFQRRMAVILEGLEGVLCLVDDVQVFGSDQQEHDRRLRGVLERLNKARVTLNAEKCDFSRKEIKFLGHVVNHRGVHPDPDKTTAIQMMPKPKDVSELRRLLGMINEFNKFSPRIADLTQPLRELLSARNVWQWSPKHDLAFAALKQEITKHPPLHYTTPK